MPTTTLRENHEATPIWTDLTLSIPDAAGKDGFVKHLGGTTVEVIFGGDTRPPATIRGVIITEGGEEWGAADHIWVRCRPKSTATLSFQIVEA